MRIAAKAIEIAHLSHVSADGDRSEGGKQWCATGRREDADDPVPGRIYLDAAAFGAGSCCTQASKWISHTVSRILIGII